MLGQISATTNTKTPTSTLRTATAAAAKVARLNQIILRSTFLSTAALLADAIL